MLEKRNPKPETLELREKTIIRPKDVQFELVFREDNDLNKNRIEFEPVGEFHYFSGSNRPIAPTYKLYLPERYKGKENMEIVFEEMSRYLAGQFAGWLAPETEEDFSVCLFGGYDTRIRMKTYNNFFPSLRYYMEKKGISISENNWDAILKYMDGLMIDIKNLFPSDDLPFNEKSYEDFWQYEVFGVSPPKPPSCSKESFLPPTIRIKIDDDLFRLTTENRKIIDDLMLSGEKWKPASEIQKGEPIQLKERYQCIYGVGSAGQTMESMSYYPEIGNTPSDVIEINPNGIIYEHTASATPEIPSQGWRVIFPQGTPSDTAAIFMHVLREWDGLRVLDELTVTESGRVEVAFMSGEINFPPENYKKFKEWVKGKKVKSTEPTHEINSNFPGEKPS